MVVRQWTQISNMLCRCLGEFGIVIAQGIGSAEKFAKAVLDGNRPSLHEVAIDVLTNLSGQMVSLHLRILWHNKRILIEGRRDRQVVVLRPVPSVGAVTASAIVVTAGEGHQFRNGREFVAWLGLGPVNRSSDCRERLGRISIMGVRSFRHLLAAGITARLRHVKDDPDRADPLAIALLEREAPRLATVAMAYKTAWIVWAILTRNERYQPHAT